ncbi:checkpoint protein [Plasmopara halstedii]|uniref:Checkpoint protein n=1 Tax=Plasmopara halstedii TaxID=4781 RepID=A0A0P1B5S5_PLAHL|nr:checkpoint protein [Plasmopara halstedii]CEG48865.1 checkpoint protein [Plasmopara halstedii]|eukprot:XP_024585234.1 checkpoint protein [Plasmopara halstedii]
MRFRGTLAKDALVVLLDIAQSFVRLGSQSSAKTNCVFTLTLETLSIALKSGGAEELQSFARLQTTRLFHDVVVQSRAENHIGFLCDMRHFQQALTSGKDASAVMLRLLKRDGSNFLCLRTRAVDIDIIQSIPIEVLAMSTIEHYQEPCVPAPDIAIEMPPLRALRSIVDKLKGMHKTMSVEASRMGTVILRIDTNPVTLQTLFAHLRYRDDLIEDGGDDEEEKASRREKRSFTVTVDSKVLSKAILVDGQSTASVLCCITENQAMVLHSILVDSFGSFTCYIPVLTPDL